MMDETAKDTATWWRDALGPSFRANKGGMLEAGSWKRWPEEERFKDVWNWVSPVEGFVSQPVSLWVGVVAWAALWNMALEASAGGGLPKGLRSRFAGSLRTIR